MVRTCMQKVCITFEYLTYTDQDPPSFLNHGSTPNADAMLFVVLRIDTGGLGVNRGYCM